MKFAICNETFQDWSFEDQLETVSKLGYEGLEIAPFTFAEDAGAISAAQRKEMKDKAEGHGLHLTGLHWLLVKPDGLYLTDPDDAVRTRTVDYLRTLIDFCADIGGKTLVFGSPAQRNVKDGVSFEQAWGYARDGFRKAAETAGERDVFLLMESLPAPECNFITNLGEAIRMIQDVDHPNFQAMVDVKSMSSEGKPLDELIQSVGGRLKYVHANDANRRGPGFGDTDFRPVFRALKELNYDGYLSVEVFDYSPDPVTIARESLRYLNETLAEIEKEL